MMPEVSLPDLNRDCWRHILLYLDFPHRIKLREVCKAWRDVSDDFWSGPRQVTILYPDPGGPKSALWYEDGRGLTVDRKDITIRTSDASRVEGVLKRFGDTIIDLVQSRKIQNSDDTGNNCLLSFLIKYCPSIRKLDTLLATKVDEENLVQFAATKKLEQLIVQLHGVNHGLNGFDQISTEDLQLLDVSWFDCAGPRRMPDDLKRMLEKRSPSLRALVLHRVDDEHLKIIGEKVSLWRLKLHIISDTWMREGKSLNPILQLTRLRELCLAHDGCYHTPYVTEDFLMGLAESLPLLEIIEIRRAKPTNRGIRGLASLKNLRKLRIEDCRCHSDTLPKSAPLLNWALLWYLDELDLTCCDIRDQHAIDLLRSGETMRLLSLNGCKGITNETLIAAVDATKMRTNGISLTLQVRNTSASCSKLTNFHNDSPFLKIIDGSVKFDQSAYDDFVFSHYLESLGYSDE